MIECFRNENQQNDIHVLDTFNDLVYVGEYIGIADKGTEGSEINIQVKQMLIDYQALVRNCVRDLKTFKLYARDALEQHVLAVELFNANEYTEAILALAECKVIHNSMNRTV